MKQTPPSMVKPSESFRNKIMNDNIVSTIKNPLLSLRRECAFRPMAPPRATGDLFEDFEQNFLEANLDKVISLEELKSVAEAIGQRDWGYVKYILTIICLILKSYQSISRHADESLLRAPSGGLKLIVPERRPKFRKHSDSSRETKAFNSEEINDQLMSLNKIIKQMKTGETRGPCWACQDGVCPLHGAKREADKAGLAMGRLDLRRN